MPNLVHITLAWLLGILIGGWLRPPTVVLLCYIPVTLSIPLLWRREPTTRRWGVYILFLLLGTLRLNLSQPRIDAGHIAYYNERGAVTLTGVVITDPDQRDTYTNLRLRVSTLSDRQGQRAVRGDILLRTGRYPAYQYGDLLQVRGALETPFEADDFSYKEYLARQGIHALLRRAQITRLAQGQGNPLYALLFRLRGRAREVIAAIMPEPEASLLTGILLGIESGIPETTWEAFVRTGTVHILVISGFNLSLIAGLFVHLLTRLGNRRRIIPLAALGLLLYVLMVGASPPVLRAALMVGVALLAYRVGRPYEVGRALAGAIMLMSALNPHLLWDVSFQLSATATLGLLVGAPELERWLGNRLPIWLSNLLIPSFSAQLFTMPVILYHFGRLSLISLLTNALILPAQPHIMTLGGLATLVGLALQPLGRILGWIPWLLLAYTTRVVEWTAQPSWATVALHFTGWMVMLYYALLIAGFWLIRQPGGQSRPAEPNRTRTGRAPRIAAVAALAPIAALIWIAALGLSDGRLHVHFLDVGQGDAILIQTPRGEQVLIDGSAETSRLLNALGRRLPFWDRTLELVALSHADMDHLGGLIAALERYHVSKALQTENTAQTPPLEHWQKLLRGVPEIIPAQAGLRLTWADGLSLECLHPPSPAPKTGDNNGSVVLRLSYGRTCFLFTGDIESEAETQLLASGKLTSCQVLKVSHHGAAEASTAHFLAALQPQFAVISVGQENRYGHPAESTLKRLQESGARILRTDQRGDIEIISDGSRLELRTAR